MSAVRPFRFGVSIWGAATREEWRTKAQRAEAAGFDVVLTADHLVDGMLSPMIALAAAAEATTRLRVGTLVLNNDFRHPVVVARDAAALDVLIDGRFELGIGAGHMQHEYDAAGITFDSPAVRVARMTEAVQIVRRLLDGEDVDFEGHHYRVERHHVYPRPVGRVPILVGGNGRGVLSTAARHADIVGFTGFSQVEGAAAVNPSHYGEAGLAAQLEWVRSASGPRFPELELSTLVQGVVLTNARRTAARELRPLLPMLTEDEILTSPYSLIGTSHEIAEQLQERRHRLGVSYITVFEKDLDAMASVIELLR